MKPRDVALDRIKILACFLVIINHTSIYLFDFYSKTDFIIIVYSAFFMLSKMAVPLFIMVTGSLLLGRDDSYSISLTRIYRVIVPMLALSAFATVYWDGWASMRTFLPTIIQRTIIPAYWYIYILIGLYLVYPFVGKMVRNFDKTDFRRFILLFLILPATTLFLTKLTGFSLNEELWSAFFPQLIGYFVAGYALKDIVLSKRQGLAVGLMVLLLWLGSTWLMASLSFGQTEVNYVFDGIYPLNTALLALGTFMLINSFTRRPTQAKARDQWVSRIADLTFGIYLIHTLIQSMVGRLAPIRFVMSLNPIFGLLLMQVTLFVVCGLIIAVLRLIPLVKKFI